MEVFGRFHLAEPLEHFDTWESHRAYTVTGSIVRPVLLKREPTQQPGHLLNEEAEILSRLAHPNVGSFVDAGEIEGWSYLAMAFTPGKPLSAMIERSHVRGMGFDLHAALYILIQSLQGLAHAHEQSDGAGGLLGIVHRDMGPHAIHIGYGGQVQVGSFGYAQYRGRRTPLLPPGGAADARLSYASPELALGDAIDHRSDIFSAGLLLYELLAGRAAYEWKSPLEARARAQRGVVPSLGVAAPHLPPEVVQVVERALVLDRNARHPSAQVFRDELQRLLYTREPTYGPHRLASLVALLLGDDAADDQRRDQEARAMLSNAPAPSRTPSVPASAPTPAFGSPAPVAITPAFGAPVPTSNRFSPPLEPVGGRLSSAPSPAPLPRAESDAEAHLDAFGSPPAGMSMPFRPMTGEMDGLHIGAVQTGPEASAPVSHTPPPTMDPAVHMSPNVAIAVASRPLGNLGPMETHGSSHAAAAAASAAPPAFETSKSSFGKIVAGVLALVLVAGLGFTFSSQKRTQLVTRKLRTALIGRKPGAILTIESIPPGAKVLVDFEDTGRSTPVTIENIESMVTHDLTLELAGEPSETATISLTAGQKKTITLAFRNAVVNFSAKTDPVGASLVLDGREVALTPASLTLRTGTPVSIKINKLGYLPFEQQITPEHGKPINLDLKLEKSEEMKAAEAAEAAAIKAAEEEESGGAKKKKKTK